MVELLTGWEVDRLLRCPRGRSLRLARKGLLPAVTLPDGELRFHRADLERMLATRQASRQPEARR